MTPPGGSRDDDADNAPRREAVPRQGRSGAPGAAPDDAPDDARAGEPGNDPQLHAMRAVWLTMRDEDPPDRGLAALLAAARHKAEAMQPRPSAWQRLLAALRRPSALALATVTVLIAGAVLIGRRVPHEAASGLTASHHEAAGPARPTALDQAAGSSDGDLGARAGPAGMHRFGQPVDPGDPPAVSAPSPVAPAPAPTALPPAPGVRLPTPAHIATVPASATSPAADTPGEAPRHPDDDRAAAGPPPAAPPPPADLAPAPGLSPSERATQVGASAALSGADTSGGNNPRSFARPPREEPKAQPPAGVSNDGRNDTANNAENTTASNAANPVTNGVMAPARRPAHAPPRSDAGGDPYEQCEAAARRSDCAVVRRLVVRITRSDPGYRARVVKDSPVGRCLAE